MSRLSRVSHFAIVGLLLAAPLTLAACRGLPSRPVAATRTPTTAAASPLAHTTTAATGPAGRGETVALPAGATVTNRSAATAAPVGKNATKIPAAGATSIPAAGVATVIVPATASGGGQPAGSQCAAFEPTLQVAASATQVNLGRPVTITATLANNGCGTLSRPEYYLRVSSTSPQAALQPGNPPAVLHSVGVNQGHSDTAVWVLRAGSAGKARVIVSAIFQGQGGAGSAGTWDSASAQPVVITVTR